MVKMNEALRDPRTGLLPETAGLLRTIANRPGTRGPHEVDRDIAALARVVLDLHEAVRGTPAPADEPPAPGRTVARGAPGWKPVTHWRTARAQEEQGPEATLEEDLEEAGGEQPERAPSTKRSRPSAFLDAISTVLGSVQGRWWESSEVAEALVKVGAVATLDVNLISRTLTRHRGARGWGRRQHPADGRRYQYRMGVEGGEA